MLGHWRKSGGKQTWTHVLQIRLLVGSSRGDKSAGVSAWQQTAAPWGLTDPGEKGGERERERETAGCDEHLLALSPLPVSLPRSFALSVAPGEPLHAPLSSLCILTPPMCESSIALPLYKASFPLYMCLRPSRLSPLSHCGKLCFISLWVGSPSFILKISNRRHFYRKIVKYPLKFS